jgi:hypothetical protein
MSMAPRLAKWTRVPHRWAGQPVVLGQRVADSPSGRTSGVPHSGQAAGNFQRRSPLRRLVRTGPTTSGMTSPALRTNTVSPGRTSRRTTSSWLWRVARPTVDPAISTGSRTANGVATPVRPIETMMSLSRVVRSSGGYL